MAEEVEQSQHPAQTEEQEQQSTDTTEPQGEEAQSPENAPPVQSNMAYYMLIVITYSLHWIVIASMKWLEGSVFHRLVAIIGFCIDGLPAIFASTLTDLLFQSEALDHRVWAVITLGYYAVFCLPTLGYCSATDKAGKRFFILLQLLFVGLHLATSIDQMVETTEILLN